MALKDQPYLPLYVDDFLSDEKLSLCSVESTGVYIRLMCLMHKSDEYGAVLLKQKFKQNVKQVSNFACMLAKQMPYTSDEIESSLTELLDMEVVHIDCENEDRLYQKRMVKDGKISTIRALAGSKGGEATQSKEKVIQEVKQEDSSFAADFALAKDEANSVIGIGTVIDNVNTIDSVIKVPSIKGKKPEAEPKPYEEIIGYLNQIAGTHFQFDTPTTQKLIDARLKKYTVEDFRTVIDKKCKEWLNTEMEKNIKPSTLFALSHFDDYLNQLVGTGKPTYNKPVDTRNDINKDYSEGEDFIQFCARRHKEEDEQKAKEPK